MYKRYKDGEAVDSTVIERIKKLEEIGFIWSLAPGEEEAEGSCSSRDEVGDSDHGHCQIQATSSRVWEYLLQLNGSTTDRVQEVVNVGVVLEDTSPQEEEAALRKDKGSMEASRILGAYDVEASESDDYDAQIDESEEADEDDVLVI